MLRDMHPLRHWSSSEHGMATILREIVSVNEWLAIVHARASYVILDERSSPLTISTFETENPSVPKRAHFGGLITLDLLQTEFRYDFRKGPREISAGTVFTLFTVFICILAFNYRKYRKFRTGRNLTRTFPKIVPKFVLQRVYTETRFTVFQRLHAPYQQQPRYSQFWFVRRSKLSIQISSAKRRKLSAGRDY